VAHSSWETWLDGYVPGAPYRKTNIYDEGNLIAFMLDVMIMRATGNKKRLRDVCVLLYERFGKKGKGYSEKNIVELVNEISGQDLSQFFTDFVYTPNDFELPLRDCFDYLGIEFIKQKSEQSCENNFGFKITHEHRDGARVSLVAPYSPAWKAGLFANDEITAVNGMMLKNNLNNWLHYYIQDDQIALTVNSADQLKTILLQKDKKGNSWFFNPLLKLKSQDENRNSVENFSSWRVF
jgi:predicted metalloprotease with PDZ domain